MTNNYRNGPFHIETIRIEMNSTGQGRKMADDILIIGAGQAAAQAVQSLRAEGFEGPIRLFGDEPYAPYQRPPLSKKFLAGEIGYDRVELKSQDFYEQANVETHWGTRVTEIDRKNKR